MRILVTGATGFIGNILVKKLKEKGFQVAIHTRNPNVSSIDEYVVFSGELLSLTDSIQQFSPQIVYHLAGSSVYPKNSTDTKQLWDSNFEYGLVLLEILKNQKELIFVNFNTSLAYNGSEIQPYTYYALTKASFIHPLKYYAYKFDISVINLILYNVYGKGDRNKRALDHIIDSLDSISVVEMSPGEQVLDFIHVDDVVNLCMEILTTKLNSTFEDIHVGTGVGLNLKQTAKIIEELSKKTTHIHFGAIPYRMDEKMNNIAPIQYNRFWKSTIKIEEGFLSLLY